MKRTVVRGGTAEDSLIFKFYVTETKEIHGRSKISRRPGTTGRCTPSVARNPTLHTLIRVIMHGTDLVRDLVHHAEGFDVVHVRKRLLTNTTGRKRNVTEGERTIGVSHRTCDTAVRHGKEGRKTATETAENGQSFFFFLVSFKASDGDVDCLIQCVLALPALYTYECRPSPWFDRSILF